MKPLLLRTALIAIVLAVTGVPLAAQKSFRVNPVAGYRPFPRRASSSGWCGRTRM